MNILLSAFIFLICFSLWKINCLCSPTHSVFDDNCTCLPVDSDILFYLLIFGLKFLIGRLDLACYLGR